VTTGGDEGPLFGPAGWQLVPQSPDWPEWLDDPDIWPRGMPMIPVTRRTSMSMGILIVRRCRGWMMRNWLR
jgi:hypothetical protein